MKTIKLLAVFGTALLFNACSKKENVVEESKVNKDKSVAETLSATSPYAALNLGASGSWKLSEPVDQNGGNTLAATTVTNDSLAAGHQSSYFYTLEAPYQNVVRFWCPANGATTTPGSGSDHPRTELIETTGNWYTKDQAGISGEKIGGRMEATVCIKQWSDVKDVIIGQIHGAGTSSSVPFVMMRMQGDSLFVVVKGETSGNANTKKGTLLRHIGLNDIIKFTITDSTNNRLYFKASCSNNSLVTGTGNWNTAVPTPFESIPVRFQVGNYLQDHQLNAANSVGCKLNMYSLKITHY